jgi:hypothetical protein
MLQDGGEIGGDEHFIFTKTYDNSTSIPDSGGDDAIRLLRAEKNYAMMTLDVVQCFARSYFDILMRR